ncbi:MAG: 16S rRNA (cytosine(1402)-N(4))-methyltransferase, partial [Candidatus Brocadiae bacterium]|nr:16S rRNA (cytosine(1402)-N(4))-methyltransferase [Candidatus Brocadiia bacterium]
REMEELDALLEALPALLKRGGRTGVLTYHSLEARRVKHAWRRQAKEGVWQLLTPSPVKPSREQLDENPRIRSAQLRAARSCAPSAGSEENA